MDLLTIENLLTYWRLFGSSEVPMPKGAETLIKDTIQALEKYKKMGGIQQGRLWAVRNSPNSPIFHIVETRLPALFRTRKDAEVFKKRIKQEAECDVEILEVSIVAKGLTVQ